MIVRSATRDDCAAIAALHAASWKATYGNILTDAYFDHHVVDDRLDLWAARLAKFDAAKHVACVADDHGSMTGFVGVLLGAAPELGALLDHLHIASSHHAVHLSSVYRLEE